MPLVSIALSMYNSEKTIESAIRSLQLQSFGDWELLLFDDGSIDNSFHRVEAIRDPRIRVMRDGHRRGLAARLNEAIDMARGRYLARMDADDIAYPRRFEHQLEFLGSHPKVDLVGTGMMIFENDGKPVGLYPTRATHEQLCANPTHGFYLAHPTWMGLTEWFRRWGYNSRYRKAQDQDLLLRACASSRYAALPEPLLGYRRETLSIRKSIVGRYYFSQALARVSIRDRRYLEGGIAIARQAALGVFDSLSILSGMSRTLLSHRALPYSHEEAARWEQVWRQCKEPVSANGSVIT